MRAGSKELLDGHEQRLDNGALCADCSFNLLLPLAQCCQRRARECGEEDTCRRQHDTAGTASERGRMRVGMCVRLCVCARVGRPRRSIRARSSTRPFPCPDLRMTFSTTGRPIMLGGINGASAPRLRISSAEALMTEG